MVEYPPELREFFAKHGKRGGRARAKKMTKEERAASARRAAQARWAKKTAKPRQ